MLDVESDLTSLASGKPELTKSHFDVCPKKKSRVIDQYKNGLPKQASLLKISVNAALLRLQVHA